MGILGGERFLMSEVPLYMVTRGVRCCPGRREGPEVEVALPRYRGTSLIRNTPLLGPYSRTLPRVIWWS
jgi:hypothetical protein